MTQNFDKTTHNYSGPSSSPSTMARVGVKVVLLVLCLFNVRTNLKASRRLSEKLNQLQEKMKTAGGNTHFQINFEFIVFVDFYCLIFV